jgi:ribulose-5-phosphate 4-epimerase/fuculose-1-phosphate aldolase
VSAAPIDAALVDRLVVANRILYDQGVVDGFGHVSVRDPAMPGCFLLSRSRAPALVTRADILRHGPDGEPVAGDSRATYLERYIHSEIYRVRPDVQAVVHNHSPAVIPFGVTGTPLRPVFHMSGFLGVGSPVFEIRAVAGASDLLIRSRELGAAMARTLGAQPMVLMRGHGATVVGGTLEQAVYRSVYAEVNARLQRDALALGPVTYLDAEEAALAAATNDGVLGRTWELWQRRVGPIE